MFHAVWCKRVLRLREAFCPSVASVGSGRLRRRSGRAGGRGGAAAMPDNAASALCYLLIGDRVVSTNRTRTSLQRVQSIFSSWRGSRSSALGIVLGTHLVRRFGIHSLYSWRASCCGSIVDHTFQGKTTVLPVIVPLAQQQA